MNILTKHTTFTLQRFVFTACIACCTLCTVVFSPLLLASSNFSGTEAHTNPKASPPESGLSNPSSLDQCYLAARHVHSGQAQIEGGIKACTDVLRHTTLPKKARAQVYLQRGVLYKRNQQPQLALREFFRAKRIAGDSPALSVNIGNVYYLKREFQRAIGAYDRALAMNLATPHKALLNRGLANERLGRRQEAINAYVQALAIKPALATAQQRLQALTSPSLALSYSQAAQESNLVEPGNLEKHKTIDVVAMVTR